ncbi:MAG: ABC transporter permease [Cyclobacteriaceae bacterium]
MFRNYIKTALRSLFRHRFFSFINIFGLAVSMTICMAIMMLVADQMTYDRFNTNRDRIYRINSQVIHGDGTFSDNITATSAHPLGEELRNNYTGIAKVVRIKRGFGNSWIEFDQNVNIPLSGYFADPEFFEVFQYEMEYGDPRTALKEPYSVVLTHKAARKLFKEENPVGLTVKVGDKGVYNVTGVLKETNKKSHIVFEALASMSTVKSLEASDVLGKESENWHNYWQTWTYILLEDGKTESDISPYFDKIYKKHIAPNTNPDVNKAKFQLQPMMNITPGPMRNNPIGPFLPWIFIYFFAGLAALVMLTSCFNFTNLSIARSLTRAKEIGIRKATGAMRWQIFTQFLSEAVITTFLALVIAVAMVLLLKPVMLQLNFARVMKWDLEANLYVYAAFVVFALAVGILAGLFPAVVLSGFQPVKVLKSVGNVKLFSRMGLRKALLVSQFTLSLIFILSVLVVFNQLRYFIKADLGFQSENQIMIRLNGTKPELLKTELLEHANVVTVSASSHVPAAGSTYGMGFKKSLEEKNWTNVSYYAVDEDYISNMKLTLLAGRNFEAAAGESNKNFILVNEEALKTFHFANATDALGQELIMDADSIKVQIIGVLKNYNHQLLMQKLEPMALRYNPSELSILQVEYTGTFVQTAKTIETAWAAVNPAMKVDYKSMKEEIETIYNIFFGDIVKVVGVVAFLAIMISCLGLLGMATYATETRIKEISIRKVLGSSSSALILLLSKGFLAMLGIAVAVGLPAAYFINNLWLEMIAYHVTMDWTVMVTGVLVLIFFGVLTVGSQTIRATFVKPVENLKSE